jgi:DNA-binding transcriptional LysR family regulator
MSVNRLDQIQAFVAVVEHSGFTRAAHKMAVAKSSLSRRVSELEQRLGVQLLQRTTRKLSLTDEGEQFFQAALRILAELDEAEQEVSHERLQPRGRIRIAAPMSFSQAHLPSVISEFLRDFREIQLEIDLNDRQVDLVEDGFDIAIRIGNLADSSLKARKLGVVRFATAASDVYLQARGVAERPADLKQHDGLYYSNISPQANWSYRIEGTTQSVLPRKVLASNNGDFLARAAAAGLGVISAPTFILHGLIERTELRPILEEYAQSPVGLYAVFPPGRLVPARVRLLVDFLRDRFGERPYWDRHTG